MPLSKVVFNEASSAAERSVALQELRRRLDSGEVSATKRLVLLAVWNYAAKNLIDVDPLDSEASLHTSICNAIFACANWDDLLFLQRVVNLMNRIKDETSTFKKAVLPKAQAYKRSLVLPLVRQMQDATLGFELAALFMQNAGRFLLDVAAFFTRELSVEERVDRLLNDCLAQACKQGRVPYLASSFDDNFAALSRRFAQRGCVAAFSLFNRIIQTSSTVSPLGLNNFSKQYQPK